MDRYIDRYKGVQRISGYLRRCYPFLKCWEINSSAPPTYEFLTRTGALRNIPGKTGKIWLASQKKLAPQVNLVQNLGR